MSNENFFKSNWNSIFKPVTVLLAICIIIPLALALTNSVTKEPIAKQEEEQRAASMAELFPGAAFDEKEDYAVAESGDETVGYVFTTAAKGYGDDVKVMTAIQADGTVKAVKILSVDGETPGLGQNALKQDFGFAGMAAEKCELTKNGGSIKPITGATITSTAVKDAVNEAIEIYLNKAVKEEQ